VALTSQQIIALACQDAKVPGWTQQAGQHMIAVLDELCETYDWEATKVNFNGVLNPGVADVADTNIVAGQGPNALPAGYLRMVPRTFVYLFNGVPYPLTNWEDADFDQQVQQVGIASLARDYITDLSNPAAPVFFIYPPTNGAYHYRGRCHIRMPDIGSGTVAATGWDSGKNPPESSAVVPWFPNTTYLRTRIAGELMKSTGDKRMGEFLGKGPEGAQGILERLLQMVDDKQSRAQKISLDRRTFRPNQAGLPDTKNIFG
jgi:hypothetical protein